MSVTSKKILFVVTSHDRKGTKPSGYFLSEVTHPHRVLAEAGYAIEFMSPQGGKAPSFQSRERRTLRRDSGVRREVV